jgi:hypothetical protein
MTLFHTALRVRAPHDSRKDGLFYRAFLSHPHAVNESYGRHLWFTVRIACYLLLTSAIIVAHGLLPFLFDNTGSRRIAALHARFTARNTTTHDQPPARRQM